MATILIVVVPEPSHRSLARTSGPSCARLFTACCTAQRGAFSRTRARRECSRALHTLSRKCGCGPFPGQEKHAVNVCILEVRYLLHVDGIEVVEEIEIET